MSNLFRRALKSSILYNSTRTLASRTSSGFSDKGLKSWQKIGVISLAIGGTIGGANAVYNYIFPPITLKQLGETTIIPWKIESSPPSFEPASIVRYPEDRTGLKLTLYQYATCPFCCKVRAFLDYHGLSYNIIEVNSVKRNEVKWSSYKKVPILTVETPAGEIFQLNDSSLIISAMKSFLMDRTRSFEDTVNSYVQIKQMNEKGALIVDISNKYFFMYNTSVDPGKSKEAVLQEQKWRKWVDNVFVHTISPNIYRTPSEALESFKWFDRAGNWENLFSSFERGVIIYLGALVMYIIGKRLQMKYGLKDDVRQSIFDEINKWTIALKKNKTPFMGGDKPDASDLALYGVLSSIEGCEAFQDILSSTKIKNWFVKMKYSVGSRAGNDIHQIKS